jgi:hypothetical protein
MWIEALAIFDWPEEAKPYVEGESLMVPEIYERQGQRVVEWARVTSREQLLRALGMGPVFD